MSSPTRPASQEAQSMTMRDAVGRISSIGLGCPCSKCADAQRVITTHLDSLDALREAVMQPLGSCDEKAYVAGGYTRCGARLDGMLCLCERHSTERDAAISTLTGVTTHE